MAMMLDRRHEAGYSRAGHWPAKVEVEEQCWFQLRMFSTQAISATRIPYPLRERSQPMHRRMTLAKWLGLERMIVALALVAAATARGETYFVALNGSDSNPGTKDRPFQTLHAGIRRLQPGDTLSVREGVYHEPLIDTIPGGTSWQAPVTLTAFEGEKVTICAPPGATEVLRFSTASSSYVVIRSFTLDGGGVTSNVVKVTYTTGPAGSSHHIRIQDCEVKGSRGQGILVSGPAAHENEFINLHVHHNGVGDKFAHGFYIETDRNLIAKCRVHNNGGHGIQIYSTGQKVPDYRPDQNLVRDCVSYHNATRGIGLYMGLGNSAYNNVVWGNDGGIAVTSAEAQVCHNTVTQNSGYGIKLQSVTKVVVRNNIVSDTAGPGLWIDPGSSNAVISNNLLARNGGRDLLDEAQGTRTTANLIGGAGPGFLDASKSDFHLRAGSPAIDAGVLIPEVTTDIDGVKRPQEKSPDLGAYEFGRSGEQE
jgi:Right handed beta helix region